MQKEAIVRRLHLYGIVEKGQKINHWLPVYWDEEGIVYKEAQGNLGEVGKIVSSFTVLITQLYVLKPYTQKKGRFYFM